MFVSWKNDRVADEIREKCFVQETVILQKKKHSPLGPLEKVFRLDADSSLFLRRIEGIHSFEFPLSFK